MREVKLDNHIESLKKKKEKLGSLPRTKGHRTRPREREERIALAILDYHRVKKAMQDGILEKIGPREYRYNG